MEKRKTKNFNWLEFGAAKVKIFIFVRRKKMMELYGKKKKKYSIVIVAKYIRLGAFCTTSLNSELW